MFDFSILFYVFFYDFRWFSLIFYDNDIRWVSLFKILGTQKARGTPFLCLRDTPLQGLQPWNRRTLQPSERSDKGQRLEAPAWKPLPGPGGPRWPKVTSVTAPVLKQLVFSYGCFLFLYLQFSQKRPAITHLWGKTPLTGSLSHRWSLLLHFAKLLPQSARKQEAHNHHARGLPSIRDLRSTGSRFG